MNIWRSGGIAVCFLLSLSFSAAGQGYLNLDFETTSRGQPWGWGVGTVSGYEIAPDHDVVYSGSGSMHIKNTGAAADKGISAGVYIQGDAIRGKHVRVSGYLKTAAMTRGIAGFFCRVDGSDLFTSPASARATTTGPGGPAEWEQYSFEIDVSADAVGMLLGFAHTGDGTVWFDAITISMDGEPYVDGPLPNTGSPTQAQSDWLRANASTDLAAVSDIVGDAHIVAVGEGTHGTSEFFQMKHRILKYLAENKGFTIFAIEANQPEAELMNRYVLYGEGDPRKLLRGLYFWTWNTQEVLDMLLWMREYNASGNGPVQFTGFDMQYSAVAALNVQKFLESADPEYRSATVDAYARANVVNQNYLNGVSQSNASVQAAVNGVHAIWQHLTDNRDRYVETMSAREVDWAIQNAVVVEQATTLPIASSAYRDQAMAMNLEWILSRNPGQRAMVWAHNWHASRGAQEMGSYLAAKHSSDYVAFAQLFHQGTYNACCSLGPWYAPPSFPGTVEYALHSAGMPLMILDLRKASMDDPGSAWLLGAVQYRSIGSIPADGFMYSNRLVKDFDAVIFFDKSTPSTLLPF